MKKRWFKLTRLCSDNIIRLKEVHATEIEASATRITALEEQLMIERQQTELVAAHGTRMEKQMEEQKEKEKQFQKQLELYSDNFSGIAVGLGTDSLLKCMGGGYDAEYAKMRLEKRSREDGKKI